MTGKTRDGIKLANILQAVSRVQGLSIREGAKHPYILLYDGLRPCPLAESTDAEKMLTPWLKMATGYKKREIYERLKAGQNIAG